MSPRIRTACLCFAFTSVATAQEPASESAPVEPVEPSSWELPDINVYVNGLWRVDDTKFEVGGKPITDRVYIREAVIGMRGEVASNVEGVFMGGFTATADPNRFEPVIEAAHARAYGLRPWEETPLEAELWLGRFRSSFGRANRRLVFDLPLITRPLPVVDYLGANGYVTNGARGLLRFGEVDGTSIAGTIEVVNSGDVPIVTDSDDPSQAYVVNLDWRQRISDPLTMKTGLSGYRGRQTTGSRGEAKMLGADWMLEWRPERDAFPYSGDAGVEFFRVFLPQQTGQLEPDGFYAWAQVQILRNAYLGLRYEASEQPEQPDLRTSRAGIYGAYVPTDRLRLGLGFHRLSSDDPDFDGALTLLAELSFAFGRSPRAPAWVHRASGQGTP